MIFIRTFRNFSLFDFSGQDLIPQTYRGRWACEPNAVSDVQTKSSVSSRAESSLLSQYTKTLI